MKEYDKKTYDKFINENKDFLKKLVEIAHNEKHTFEQTKENKYYNLETEKDPPSLSTEYAIANANEFISAYDTYLNENPKMDETEAKSRVVFDFLQSHKAPFSYEENRRDILFGNISRENFYANQIYKSATSNTDFYSNHIGNIKLMCIEPKGNDEFPRDNEELSTEKKDAFLSIPTSERLSIIYERGFYHEATHIAFGTNDERKCDCFALLKVMKNHPKHAETIFSVYNQQRAKIGYTIRHLNSLNENNSDYKREISKGTMTYIMPKTYERLKEFAKASHKIPGNDKDLMKLTYSLVSDYEFSDKNLQDFYNLTQKSELTPKDIEQNEIVKSCMKQGGFENITDYIKADKNLSKMFPSIAEKNITTNDIKNSKETSKEMSIDKINLMKNAIRNR